MKSPLRIGDVALTGRVLIAPMTGVSDLPFRRAASRLGAAYVATEMVACEALARGRPDMVRRAAVGEGLPLTVIQLVGRDPVQIAAGARMAEAAGADIVDLNMGCPAKLVTGALSGSALMRDLDEAERLIDAAVAATTRPVTLKMRLGWDEHSRNAVQLAARAEQAGIAAVTVHGRTRQQFYTGAADWRAVAPVKRAVRIPVIVNGDVTDAAKAHEALERSGADAVMIGRGAGGRPWIAAAIDRALEGGGVEQEPGLPERLGIALDHMTDSLTFYGPDLGLRMFRKHLAAYIDAAGEPASVEQRRSVRARLCRLETAAEVERALIGLWSQERLDRAA